MSKSDISLNQFHGRGISFPSNKDIVDHSKDHGAAEHHNIPVHGCWGNWCLKWEEDKDPNHQQEDHCTNVDEDAVAAKSPSSCWQWFFAKASQNEYSEGDDISSENRRDCQRANGVERYR